MTEMVIQQLLLEAGAQGDRPGPRRCRATRARSRRRLADAAVARDLPRLRPEHRLRLGGGRRASIEPHVYDAAARLPLNAWDLAGDWTVAPARRRGERARWTDRVPLPRARCQPRDGAGLPGSVRPLPGLPRWPARPGRAWDRRRRRGQRDPRRAADVSAHPPTGRDRGPAVRDRVPRRPASRPTASPSADRGPAGPRRRGRPGRSPFEAYRSPMFRMAVGHSDDVDLASAHGGGLRAVRRGSRGRDPEGRPPGERLGGRPPVRDRPGASPLPGDRARRLEQRRRDVLHPRASARTPWRWPCSRRTRSTSWSGSGATSPRIRLAAARQAVAEATAKTDLPPRLCIVMSTIGGVEASVILAALRTALGPGRPDHRRRRGAARSGHRSRRRQQPRVRGRRPHRRRPGDPAVRRPGGLLVRRRDRLARRGSAGDDHANVGRRACSRSTGDPRSSSTSGIVGAGPPPVANPLAVFEEPGSDRFYLRTPIDVRPRARVDRVLRCRPGGRDRPAHDGGHRPDLRGGEGLDRRRPGRASPTAPGRTAPSSSRARRASSCWGREPAARSSSRARSSGTRCRSAASTAWARSRRWRRPT